MAEKTREELDYLYSPSRWSKKLPADVVVSHHVQKVEEATQIAQKTLKCELNVVYDKDSRQTLDIYHPGEGKGCNNVLIYLHGGYWQELGTEHSGFMAVPFTNAGVTVVVLGYDLAPKATMTTIVEQCRRGCAYIVNRFPGYQVFISGHSAGAHLSACMLATDWAQYGLHHCPFSGAVLVSGVYELWPIQQCCVNDPLKLTDTEVQQFSPQRTLDQLALPTNFRCLLTNGDQESPEFKRQAAEYITGLRSAGVQCTHHEIAGEDHFSVVDRMSEEGYLLNKMILRFFEECK